MQGLEWAFTMQCNFDSMLIDSCLSVVDLDVRYFHNGATKHITSQCNLFYFTSMNPHRKWQNHGPTTHLIQLRELDKVFLNLLTTLPLHYYMHCMC